MVDIRYRYFINGVCEWCAGRHDEKTGKQKNSNY